VNGRVIGGFVPWQGPVDEEQAALGGQRLLDPAPGGGVHEQAVPQQGGRAGAGHAHVQWPEPGGHGGAGRLWVMGHGALRVLQFG
jgi:hypothetical protein